MAQSTQFRFAPFRLDPARASLWRDMEEVVLPPKVFDLLCYLVRHAGEVVTKDQLLDAVWQRRFVSESSLKGCVNELRQALSDDVKAPRYIATVARRGYRFIAPVSETPPISEAPILEKHAPPPEGLSRCWVKRASLLARLQPLWRSSLQGARQLVFLTGEAGIGKTTLIELFLAEVAEQAPSVLRARCVEHFGQGEALLPLLEAIEHPCRREGGASLIAHLRRHAPVWLAQLPSVLASEEREALQREILGASRERMLREGCLLMEELCGAAPLVLVVEDLHWSDYATLDLLALLAERNSPARLLVLASYRPGDAAFHGHPVTTLHRELRLRGRVVELPIEPFSPADAEEYLMRRFPDAPVPDSVVQALYAQTGGHPLFLSCLVDYLVAERQWSPRDSRMTLDRALPDTVRQVIEREIEQLSATEQGVLGIASAIGAEFSVLLLGAVLDEEPVEVDRCCDGLARRSWILSAAGLEEGAGGGTVVGRYAFRHALYVEVLYQRLEGAALLRLHRRIGECLEKLHDPPPPTVAAELALHFEHGRDWARAVRYLRQAAEHSARRFANPEALAYLERALGLVHYLPVEQHAKTQTELLREAALIQRSMSDMRGALASLEEMLRVARAANDRHMEVEALIDLSRVLVWFDRRRCLEVAQEALLNSRRLGDPVLASIALGNWGGWNIVFGQWREEYARASEESLAVARASGNPRLLHTRLTLHINVEVFASRYRTAWATAQEAIEIASQLGDGYMYMVDHYFGGLALLHLGEWGTLRKVLQQAMVVVERNGAGTALYWYRVMIGWLHCEALDFEAAKALCEVPPEPMPEEHAALNTINTSAILGQAYLGLGEAARAIACFEAVVRTGQNETLPIHRNYFFPAYAGLGEAWLAQGELAKARDYAQQLHDFSAGAPERTYLALSHRLFAEIARREQALAEAERHLATALGLVEAAEVPLAAWRVYASAAALYEQLQRPAEADIHRRRSAEVRLQLAASLDETDPLRCSIAKDAMIAGEPSVRRSAREEIHEGHTSNLD
jgi:DNA-binding winged helix-turn-helix (wHTH) protein/tetratricopeptide (TPR) repeat protein